MLDRAASTLDDSLRAALLVAAAAVGCSAHAPDPVPGDTSGGLVPGTLDVRWMHGSADCSQNTDPEIQIHAYNATTYILRQNKCRTFEAPFVYVLIGARSALSFDTGATDTPALRDAIRGLIGDKPLLAAHSHGHGDHKASDSLFAAQPGVTVVPNTVAGQQAAFGITRWPDATGHHELGDRALDVLAIPGHEPTHIAIYDGQTGLLLTGDSVYPGLLFIGDWNTYRASMHRLAEHARAHPIAHVLGAHIEMSATPKVVYPYGTTYQPDEHALQLDAAQLLELDAVLRELGAIKPDKPVVRDHYIIQPT